MLCSFKKKKKKYRSLWPRFSHERTAATLCRLYWIWPWHVGGCWAVGTLASCLIVGCFWKLMILNKWSLMWCIVGSFRHSTVPWSPESGFLWSRSAIACTTLEQCWSSVCLSESCQKLCAKFQVGTQYSKGKFCARCCWEGSSYFRNQLFVLLL